MAEIGKDNNRILLIADKGVSLVVMNKADYVEKAEELLNQPTYRTIPSDPTTKYKNKLVNLLNTIKAEGGISNAVYRRLYPQRQDPPNSMGFLKYIKKGCH